MRGNRKSGKSLDERLRAVRESAESHERAAAAPAAVTSAAVAIAPDPAPILDLTPVPEAVEVSFDPTAETPPAPSFPTPVETPLAAPVETPDVPFLDPPSLEAPSLEAPSFDSAGEAPLAPVFEAPDATPVDEPSPPSVAPSVVTPADPADSFEAAPAPALLEATPAARTPESDLAEVAHLLWAASEGDTLLASGADTAVSPRRLEQGAGRFQLAGVGPDTRQREQEARPPRRGLRPAAPAAPEGDRRAIADPDATETAILADLVDDQLESLVTVATAADLTAPIAPAPAAEFAEVEPEAPADSEPALDEIPLARRLFGFGGRRRATERPVPAASEPEPLWPEPVAPEAVLEDEPEREAEPELAVAFDAPPAPTEAEPEHEPEPEPEPVLALEVAPTVTEPEPEPAVVVEAAAPVTEAEPEPEPALAHEAPPTVTEPEPEPEPEPVVVDAPPPVWAAAEPEPVAIAPTAAPVPEPAPADDSPWRQPDRAGRFGRIGTTMIDRGLITNEQLDAALEVQRTTGRRVGEILVEMGALSRFELARVLADHMGVPFVDLRAKPPDAILGALLPEEVARRYRALVIDRWNNQLVIAMANPSDLFALDDLQMVMRQPIITAMAVEEDLLAAIDSVYRVSDVETTLDAATSDYVSKTDEAAMGAVEVDEGPVVRLVNALLDQAIRDHASDLHIEPSSSRIAIRYRVDGVLHDSSDVPLALLRPLVSRVKILSNLDIAQNRIAQDGRFSVVVQGRPVDIRVVTVPTAAGEAVILRLLDPTRDTLDISSLGLNAAEEARFVPPFFASQGAAFIVGPTGSGKTSTVYTLLSEINTRSKSIISVEDPVEYRLDGIKQIQANPRVGLTFATTLPSILRSDPDIVFVGEIRDPETAENAIQSALTGHLVLSTLHATRSAAAPMRLIEMGVEPYLVASALTLVAAQRLARKLCDRCAQAVGPAELDHLRDLGATDEILEGATVRHAVGCPACRNTGYAGRLPILEIMPVSEQISRLILDRAPRAQIERLAVEEGMETMTTAAMRRVASGVLSIEEMMRIVS